MRASTRTRLLLTVVLAGLVLAAVPVGARNHVRVVLDLSGSLKTTDPNRLVILATLLLHDLANPNTTMGDSFEIYPFDKSWRWPSSNDPPPVSNRAAITAVWQQRSQLLHAVCNLGYDAQMTYFYPGLLRAINELATTPGGGYDNRVIVLVTDGMPEPPTRDHEAQLIQQQLVPLLKQHGISLYVLGLGTNAWQNQGFFEQLAGKGRVFIDQNGSKLPANMLQIFANSFGFTPDAALQLPGVTGLDLEASTTPERVAVVLSTTRPSPPALQLRPPMEGALNLDGDLLSAGTAGGSYALRWVLAPNQGTYGFDTDTMQGSVAVLRPSRLQLKIVAVPPHNQVDRTMAETPFHLGALVSSAAGAQTDPGAVKIQFRLLGERLANGEHAWKSETNAPPAGAGTVVPGGRQYRITTTYPENPEDPAAVYAGYLEVLALRGQAVVGALRGPTVHRIEVHPLLSIAPAPLSAHVSTTALGRRERACTRFSLELAAGQLPATRGSEHAVRAVLEIPQANLDNELKEASFTLDGLALQATIAPGPSPGPWYKGHKLDKEELLGEHELCVSTGRPTRGDPGKPLDLPLHLTLLEAPYDDFAVIKDFTARILIAPPDFIERWGALLATGTGLLALLALLWYLRDRPTFPTDLGYAIGRDNGSLSWQVLPEGPLRQRLLGLVVERPVTGPGDDQTLAWVRPVNDELFQLRTVRQTRVEATVPGETVTANGRIVNLLVRNTYRLVGRRGAHLFRMEYQR